MAKIKLGRVFAVDISGPGGKAKWAMKSKHAAELKANPKRIARKRFAPHNPPPAGYKGPDNTHCECKAWTACDATYQRFDPALLAELRRRIPRRRMSAYDTYMKWAIPHAIRGMPVPPHPDFDAGQRYGHLYQYTEDDLADWPEQYIVYPMDGCHNFGLYYASCWLVGWMEDAPPDENPPLWSAFFIWAEAREWSQQNEGPFYARCVWTNDEGNMPDFQEWEEHTHYFTMSSLIWWPLGGVHFQYAPCTRTPGGEVIPDTPNLEHVIDITWHTSTFYYTHWPQHLITAKGEPQLRKHEFPSEEELSVPNPPRIPY